MDSQLKSMGKRLREIRTILEISPSEMAAINFISEEEYLRHENGEVDSSFTFLYRCAERFGVDISDLVTGEGPKLSYYTLTRKNGGMPIKRRAGFEYRHQAALLKHRASEPFVVKVPFVSDNEPIALSTHSGQEFDYILKGSFKVQLEDKIEILNEGDSIYYEANHPHGMVATGGAPCEFLAIVIKGENEEPAAFVPETAVVSPVTDHELLYKKYLNETLDENGHLKAVSFNIPENFNFAYDVVDELARKCPEKTAMLWISHDRIPKIFTYRDIAEQSAQAAHMFMASGIGKGDRVMLVLKRHYQFWIALNALHRIGAVAIPATNLLTEKDFDYRFNAVGVNAIVASADGHITEYADEAMLTSPTVRVKFVANGNKSGWLSFDEEITKYPKTFDRPAGLLAADPSVMFFSSGTTGYPKAVTHDASYPIGHIMTARWWHNVDPSGIHLTIADTGWGKALWGKIYGQWFCEAAIMTYDFEKFVPADILELFGEYNITTFCAPPTIFRFFIREDLTKYDLSSLKYATIAGEALNPEVFQQFYNATGVKLMEGFGQTETTLMIANLIGMNPKPGSMGKPSPQYNVDIIDADGTSVATGEVGEIVIRSNPGETVGLFREYFNAPEKTSEMWHDGIYHTGDTAWRDEDGYYWYVGRVDDLIKSSGYRIGPFEVESVLMELPYVLECAVTGVPDETRGQLVKATIVLTGSAVPSDELKKEIQEYVKLHTAPYKYPRVIEFVKELPKTISGKIRRVEIRDNDSVKK